MGQNLLYRINDLNVIPNAPANAVSKAYGVNEDNIIVGESTDPSGVQVAFIRLTTDPLSTLSRTQMHDLNALGNLSGQSVAHDINEAGVVAGESGGAPLTGVARIWEAHDYDPQATPDIPNFSLGFLSGGTFSVAYAINDAANPVVVGLAEKTMDCSVDTHADRAFKAVLDGTPALEELSGLSDASENRARGVSNASLVLIAGYDTPCVLQMTQCDVSASAAYWVGGGGASALVPLTSDVGEEAWDANDAGRVVGFARITVGSSCYKIPVIWTSVGANPIQLALLGNVNDGVAAAINDAASVTIVGWDESDDDALMWKQSGSNYVMSNLNDVSFRGHPTYGQFTLIEAYDVTNSGNIVGWGRNADDKERAFLLTPIEDCPADLYPVGNPDGFVGAGDLGELLANFGNPGCNGRIPCQADLIPNGAVDGDDRDYLRFEAWGNCEEGFAGGGGGGEDFSNDPDDPFVALFLQALETVGFSSVEEYFAWLDSADDEEDLAVALTIQAILHQ